MPLPAARVLGAPGRGPFRPPEEVTVTDPHPTDRLEALEGRLRRLEDAEALRALKWRYAELADARYRDGAPLDGEALARLADELAALFTEDAVWDGGPALGVCRGRSAIRERFLSPTLHFSRHYFANPRLEIEGDTARGRWEVFAPCTLRDGRAAWMAGVEHDAYRREGERWLHAAMRLEVFFLAPFERGWGERAAREPARRSS